jgi:hypothetical protein
MTATSTQRRDTKLFHRAPSAPLPLASWPLGVLGAFTAAIVPARPGMSPFVPPHALRKIEPNPTHRRRTPDWTSPQMVGAPNEGHNGL